MDRRLRLRLLLRSVELWGCMSSWWRRFHATCGWIQILLANNNKLMKFYDDEEIYASLRHFLINRLSSKGRQNRSRKVYLWTMRMIKMIMSLIRANVGRWWWWWSSKGFFCDEVICNEIGFATEISEALHSSPSCGTILLLCGHKMLSTN